MNIKLNKKYIGLFAIIIIGLIILTVGINGSSSNEAKKQAHEALLFLNEQDTAQSALDLFDTDFSVDLLGNYSYYQLDEWKLSSEQKSETKYIVSVEGTVTNAFGAKLDRKFDLVVEKPREFWYITDSRSLFDIDKDLEVSTAGMSDLEIHNLWQEAKTNIELEDWSFSRSRYGSAEGEAIIYNGSDVPVDYVKLEVNYFDDDKNLVNSDWSYAVGGDVLRPDQRRNFTWITSNCSNCTKASVDLVFE